VVWPIVGTLDGLEPLPLPGLTLPCGVPVAFADGLGVCLGLRAGDWLPDEPCESRR
jgi:hypothetical protein